MIKPTMLSLPLLLAGASCVPMEARQVSSAGRTLAYVDLAAMDADSGAAPFLGEAADGSVSAKLPVIDPQAVAPGKPAQPFDAGNQEQADGRRSLDCLTAAVYHEARSETEDGQRAVAQVVLNRVRHPAFPNSVCGVVYQGSQRTTGCQFSFTCDGSLSRRAEPSAWARARQIAADALAGSVYAPVGHATHYHTTAIRPWWAASLTRAITVGSHIFYRWRGAYGNPLAFRDTYAGAEPGAGSPAAPVVGDDTPIRVPTQGPVVRVAALVDGFKINIHRSRPAAAEAQAEPAGVKVHRSGGTEAVAMHVGEPAAITAPAAEDVASAQ